MQFTAVETAALLKAWANIPPLNLAVIHGSQCIPIKASKIGSMNVISKSLLRSLFFRINRASASHNALYFADQHELGIVPCVLRHCVCVCICLSIIQWYCLYDIVNELLIIQNLLSRHFVYDVYQAWNWTPRNFTAQLSNIYQPSLTYGNVWTSTCFAREVLYRLWRKLIVMYKLILLVLI